MGYYTRVLSFAAAGWASALCAAEPGPVLDLVVSRNGAIVRDSSGQPLEISLRAAWITDSDLLHLPALPSVGRLDLALTRISNRALDGVRSVPMLSELDLTYAEEIGDGGLAHLKVLKKLERISLEGTRVSDSGMSSLAALGTIRSLNLRCTQITDEALDTLSPLTNLEELAIGGNRITGEGLLNLRAFRTLKHLDLSGVQKTDNGLWSVRVTDLSMKALGALTGLESLNLSQRVLANVGRFAFKDIQEAIRMEITDAGVGELKSLRKLRVLDLTGAQVTGRGLEVLKELPALEQLVLNEVSSVDDGAVETLLGFRRLVFLDIRSTKITDAGFQRLSASRSLKKVRISGARIPADSVTRFRALRPDCEVVRSE